MNRITSIRFELSGFCNHKNEHEFCPSSSIEERTLSSDIIFKILVELPKDFSGDIGFHNYNEPLLDPRLYLICSQVKALLPKSKIHIYSNGMFLDKVLVKEGIRNGVDKFFVTCYNSEVASRLAGAFGVEMYPMKIDDRRDIYYLVEVNSDGRCSAPISQIIVNRFGDVTLCCLDWKNTVTFGNLYEQTFNDCFEKMESTYKSLIEGKREEDICKRCTRTRVKHEKVNI